MSRVNPSRSAGREIETGLPAQMAQLIARTAVNISDLSQASPDGIINDLCRQVSDLHLFALVAYRLDEQTLRLSGIAIPPDFQPLETITRLEKIQLPEQPILIPIQQAPAWRQSMDSRQAKFFTTSSLWSSPALPTPLHPVLAPLISNPTAPTVLAPLIAPEKCWGILLLCGPELREADQPAAAALGAYIGLLLDRLPAVQISETLRSSKSTHASPRLRALIEALPDAIVFKDADGRWQMVNTGAIELFQLHNIDWYGKTDLQLSELLPHLTTIFKVCHQSDLEAWNKKQRTDRVETITDPAGELHYFEVRKIPIFGRSGERESLVVLGRDITENRRVHEAIQESELRFRTVFENASVGIYRTNPQGTILLANRALVEMLGFNSFEELSLRDLNSTGFTPPASRQQFIDQIERERQIDGFESIWLKKDGSPVYVREAARIVFDDEGQTLYYEGTVEDISKYKAMESALRQRAVELAALHDVSLEINAAHNLPNLLETIVSQACQLIHGSGGAFFLCDPERQEVHCAASYRTQCNHQGLVLKYGEGLAGQVAQSGQPLIQKPYAPSLGDPYFDAEPDVVAVLGAPVTWKSQVTGVLLIFHCQTRSEFTPENLELITLLANQAATSIENARLFEAERTRREEAETLREATSTLASTLDLGQVLESILTQLERVVAYDSASIFLLEGEHLQGTACRGFTDPSMFIGIRFSAEDPLFTVVCKNAQPLILEDARSDPRFQGWAGTGYVRGWMGIPLIVHGQTIGYMTCDSRKPSAYTSADIVNAQAFANQAAIAIENARLFESEREARDQAEILSEIARAINASLNLDEVLRLILAQIHRVLAFDTTSILLFDEAGKTALIAGIGYEDESETARQASKRLVDSQLLKQMAQDHQPIRIPDVRQNPGWIWVPGAEHVRSFLSVPILFRQKCIGALMMDSVKVDYFNSRDEHTAQALAQHIAIAVENARLFEGERKARERAEALSEASRMLGATLSIDQVFQTVLDQLARVVPYDSGNIMLVDQGIAYPKAWRGYEQSRQIEQLSNYQFDIETNQTVGLVVRSKGPVVISDTGSVSGWERMKDFPNILSWLGVPLLVRDQVIGLISLDRWAVGGFNGEEVNLVEAFTVHASAAIENARLFAAEGKRAAELEALRQISLSLTASLELPQVLNSILNGTLNMLPEAQNSHIFLYDPRSGGQLTFGAALWADGTQPYFWNKPRPNGLTYTVARSGEAVVVPSMRTHPLFADTPIQWSGAIIGLPLKIGQRVVGVMNIAYGQPRRFPQEELHILRLLADQAAIAIENARLFAQAATERRHLGLLYDLSREVASSLDPDTILQRAITITCQGLEGLFGQGFLFLPEENRLSLRALYGREVDSLSKLDEHIMLQPGIGLAGWVSQELQPACVPDVRSDLRWMHVPGLDDEAASALCAPILEGDQLLGVITIIHHLPNIFNDEHLALVQTICQEISLALSNARRYGQVQRRLAEITLIQTLAQTFAKRLELQELLDEVVVQLANRLGYPQVEIFLVEDEGNLKLRTYYGMTPTVHMISIKEGVIGRVARTGMAALVTEVNHDIDYLPCLPGARAELAVPIYAGSAVIGVINIQSYRTNQLGIQDRNLLEVLAGQISVTLENAVLYERVRSHAEELEHVVEQRTAELTELYKLSQEISYQLSYESLLNLLIRRLRHAVGSEIVMGSLAMNERHTIILETSHPLGPEILPEARRRFSEILTGYGGPVTDESSLEIICTNADEFQESHPPMLQLGSLIHAPVWVEDRLAGVLCMASSQPNALGTENERLLTTFANQAATAVQRLEAVLRAQQQHLESLVEHLPVGTLLFDEEFDLLVANPLGREIFAVLDAYRTKEGQLRLGPYTLQDLTARQNDPLPVEITLDHPLHRVFQAQIRPVSSASGNEPGDEARQWLLTIREVTQERENQARIQSQERLATVGQLASGIAHDFNNIMAAILVYADLLRNDPSLPQASREKLTIIQQQVQRASSLIRQILDFSRRSIMEQSNLDLLPYIKELDKMLGRILPETIHLELLYQPGEYWVTADPTRLQQVFMNLALNARDAMPDGGRLRFEISRFTLSPGQPPPVPDLPPGEWLKAAISDTGCGIPAEVKAHIFEPFFTTKPVGQGTGLGLAQVYGIIKQHDGYIDLVSEVGKGTTFTIYLPALKSPVAEVAQSDAGQQALGEGEMILVVEDDWATCQAIEALLEATNYQVITASNGIEALKLYEENSRSIALVISDVVMPHMGGPALYRALCDRWPGVKMMFVTGHPLEGENQAILEEGKIHWLQKPFSVSQFIQAVQNLLQS